ncbi:MAG: cache domain-containing protein, partial [Arcobacteraceae bacterium]|nr:cache domain-containing protein [Arcobacteraceae bacterium]
MNIKNIPIQAKLLFIVFGAIIIVAIYLTIQSVQTIQEITNKSIVQYEKQVMDSKKESLKNYVDMAKGILQIYRDKVTLKMTKDELRSIKKDAIKAMDAMTYGDDNGYVFVWSYDGVPLAFNPRPDLIGKSLLHLKGGEGRWVIKDHISNAKKGGGHFYTYKWRTIKDSPYQTKISYSFGVQDWGWFVGTGEYMAKEEAQIKIKKEFLQKKTDELIFNSVKNALWLLLFIGIVFYILARNIITKPIKKLENGLNEFFSFLQNKTQVVDKIDINSFDEFGKMANSINNNISVSTKLHKEIYELNHNLEEKITEKTKELEEQKETFETIYSGSKDAIAILDMQSNFLKVNPAYLEMTGFSEAELLADSCLNLTLPDYIESSKLAMQEVLKVGYIKNHEKECIIKDGKHITINMSMSVLHNPDRILISVRDVTESKEKEKELILAKQKAEQATKVKSEFLANMSHEIRTPMNGIIGMTYLAMETNLTKKQKYYLETINLSSKSLLNIINDILDYSKIEAGKLEIHKIDFNLEQLILNISNLVKYKADEKALDFEINYPKNVSYLYGDNQRISQTLINLINNA